MDEDRFSAFLPSLSDLIQENSEAGWPDIDALREEEKFPSPQPRPSGWFRPGNQDTLKKLLEDVYRKKSESNGGKETFLIAIELGAWLGSSTKFILETAKNTLLFSVDIWENDYFYSDDHYSKEDAQFVDILKSVSIYHQFLANLESFKLSDVKSFRSNQLVPMRMDSCAALKLLHSYGDFTPDIIYVDANHHYEYVLKDIRTCLDLFPDAVLVGDDWDNAEVQRAVKEIASETGHRIFTNQGTCWTFAADRMEELKSADRAAQFQRKQQKKELEQIFQSPQAFKESGKRKFQREDGSMAPTEDHRRRSATGSQFQFILDQYKKKKQQPPPSPTSSLQRN